MRNPIQKFIPHTLRQLENVMLCISVAKASLRAEGALASDLDELKEHYIFHYRDLMCAHDRFVKDEESKSNTEEVSK